MRLNFETVDVFTNTKFGGNPLAVVLNAEGLTTEQMQAIAGEFNLAETSFVLPPKDPSHTAEVRIFTPRYEMPFAGHPNVGTGYVLARAGKSYGWPIAGDTMVFEEKAGLVRLDVMKRSGAVTGARVASPQLLSLGAEIPLDLVASAASLSLDDIATGIHTPRIASCGAPFILVELASYEALAKARANPEVYHQKIAKLPTTSIYFYCWSVSEDAALRARMFAPHHGIPEDPATGSAASALAGLLAHLRPDRDLDLSLKIAQGVEMGRPSYLHIAARKEAGQVTATYVGGECAPMLSGSFDV
ncbi:MAG: phenazine biosynthesis protein [Proteobacteria bacterium SG_bin9]|nr:MAG: phenazine biosynthesis protein [Proteobacteria bacterium SG_bin9]